MEDDIFQKIMIFQDSESTWSLAFVRAGFASKTDAMLFAIQYKHPNKTPEEIQRIYGETIERALHEF